MTTNTIVDILPLEAERRKTPRLDKKIKLAHRFYESLFLLGSFNAIRGLRSPAQPALPIDERRRVVFDSLALICDYDKGQVKGASFTAFGVSNIGGQFEFLVSSNGDEACKDILRSALQQLQTYLGTEDRDTRRRLHEEFIDYCVRRAESRIRHCARELARFIRGCLLRHGNALSLDFAEWLNGLIPECAAEHSPGHICRTMYAATKHPHWRELERKADQIEHPFPAAKHTIGRLAARLRAPRDVLRIISDNPAEFSPIISHAHVQEVPRPAALQCPPPDNLTYLGGIISRLLGDSHPRTDAVRTAILDWERYSDQEPRRYIMDRYRTCAPIVHAEISVLEWFYVHNLKFLGGDRYIFTSKPACYCCRLYFRLHPLRIKEPESHNKIPGNWGPPVYNGIVGKTQLDILNAMKAEIRNEVLDETERIVQRVPFHADSTTGVPASSAGMSGYSTPRAPSPAAEPTVLFKGLMLNEPGEFGWVYSNEGQHERDETPVQSKGEHKDDADQAHAQVQDKHEHDEDEDEGGAKLSLCL